MDNLSKNQSQSLLFGIVILGVSSILTQIIIIRELLTVFYGNELVMGLILSAWMLLTASGSMLGRQADSINKRAFVITILQYFLAFLPFVTIFCLRVFRNIVFEPGEMLSLIDITLSSIILLLPYCLISGFLFTMYCSVLSRNNENLISKVYFLDNIGSIIGGILFSFVFIFFLRTFQSLVFICLINLTVTLIISISYGFHKIRYIILCTLLISIIPLIYNLDNYSKSLEYKRQNIIEQKDTPYGNLLVTRTAEQVNFFENGALLFSSKNTIASEESVLYPMLQHDNPRNILLISGGIAGLTKVIAMFKPEKFDYLEINPALFELGRKYTDNLNIPGLNTITLDGRRFLNNTKNKYDVAIINLPEPSSAQINRFYTKEFFTQLKNKLNKDGVISLSLPATENYISKEALVMNSVLYNTLKLAFKNILIIPGFKNYFVASDKPLSINFINKTDNLSFKPEYLNKYYIDEFSLKQRSDFILKSLKSDAGINTDFKPVSYHNLLLYWLSYFKVNYMILLIILMVPLILWMIRLKPISFALFAGGFAAAGIEMIILIAFQIIYGYVYHYIGIIITLFMAGLSFGSFYINHKPEKSNIGNFIMLQILIILYLILLPITIYLLHYQNFLYDSIPLFVFSILIFAIGFLTGLQFGIASKLSNGDKNNKLRSGISYISAENYSSDLIGSALGALFVSAFLIPLIGLFNTCYIIGALNLISLVILFCYKIVLK
jgi:spermidine synthase